MDNIIYQNWIIKMLKVDEKDGEKFIYAKLCKYAGERWILNKN